MLLHVSNQMSTDMNNQMPYLLYYQELPVLIHVFDILYIVHVGAVDVLVTPETVVACPGDMVTVTCMVQQELGLQWTLDSMSLDVFTEIDLGASKNVIVNGVTFNAVLTDVVSIGSGFYNFTSTLTTTASEETDGVVIRCNDFRETSFDDVTINLMGKCG